jgi:hypothetical protein
MDEAQVERWLAAILVADIAGHSRLMAEDEATNDQALAYLEKALALDANVPEIWTNLAYVHGRAALFGWSASRSESR